jgi:hypothetical protein
MTCTHTGLQGIALRVAALKDLREETLNTNTCDECGWCWVGVSEWIRTQTNKPILFHVGHLV